MQIKSNKYLVAVLGAGTMGEGIAQTVASSGHPVMLYDVSQQQLQMALENIAKRLGVAISIYDINATVMTNSYEWGGIICSTPAEVAESSDIVFSMLPADENLLAVALGEDGIIDSLRGGLTLVDFSTLGPATIHTIDKKFGELGAHCLSAAVTLGVPRAIEGTLSIYVDMDVY